MTPAEQLRRQARELLALADSLDGTPSRPAEPDREITAETAARVLGCSVSTIYRLAEPYALGWRLPSGSWRFSLQACRAFVARDENEEFGEACRVHSGPNKEDDYSNDDR